MPDFNETKNDIIQNLDEQVEALKSELAALEIQRDRLADSLYKWYVICVPDHRNPYNNEWNRNSKWYFGYDLVPIRAMGPDDMWATLQRKMEDYPQAPAFDPIGCYAFELPVTDLIYPNKTRHVGTVTIPTMDEGEGQL